MGFFAHVQTVDTRPLFPPPTWPGYEAKGKCNACSVAVCNYKQGSAMLTISCDERCVQDAASIKAKGLLDVLLPLNLRVALWK